jgi:Predicted hydrolases or acyltransferases (alpha/beta hydrolase superfamily)
MLQRTFWTAIAIVILAQVGMAQNQRSFDVEVSGKGSPIIFIPGLASAGSTWDDTVKHYKDRFECHVLTLAGFAGKPPIDSPLLDTVAKHLVAYVQEKKLDHPVIVGHSLGGYLALKLASEHPDLFGRIVIVDALPFFAGASNPTITLEAARQMAEGMRKQMLSTIGSASSFNPEQMAATMANKPADVARIAEWTRNSDVKTVAGAMYELFSTDLRQQIAAIRVPALVLGTWIAYKEYATRDQVESNFRRQYATLPGYKLVLFDQARHFLMWDDPDMFYREVDDFLSGKTIR